MPQLRIFVYTFEYFDASIHKTSAFLHAGPQRGPLSLHYCRVLRSNLCDFVDNSLFLFLLGGFGLTSIKSIAALAFWGLWVDKFLLLADRFDPCWGLTMSYFPSSWHECFLPFQVHLCTVIIMGSCTSHVTFSSKVFSIPLDPHLDPLVFRLTLLCTCISPSLASSLRHLIQTHLQFFLLEGRAWEGCFRQIWPYLIYTCR